VPFLGHDARTPVGPARLALRSRAAVVVGVPAPRPVPSGGAALATALELSITRIDMSDLEVSDEGERILTTRINDALSARIRALPEAWVWMHPRWNTDPRTAATLAATTV
jgi:KDO2-lipid IV(A) lauroyltransferase